MKTQFWAWGWLLLLSACSARIQHGLDERQANEIQTVLVERGLKAQKVVEPGKKPTWAIEVDDAQAADAVRILAELGLPKQKNDGFGEVFGKGSLVPSATEERALYLEALTGELARTLEAVDGVASARVHLVLPNPARSGSEIPVQPKASAFLRVRPGQARKVNEARSELRELIAGSVEGLTADGVTLVVNEITSAAPKLTPAPSLVRLKMLVGGLGLSLSLLGALLIALAFRLRAYRTELQVLRTAPAPVRTVTSVSAAQRRVA